MQFRAIVALVVTLGVATPAAAIYRIDTFAGRGYGDGGPAIAASVIAPADAVTDSAGNVYFSDKGNQLVRRVDAATHAITTVAGNGSPGAAGDGGPATAANLFDPDGVALDPTEHFLYIVENSVFANRVRRVDLTTGIITRFAGTGTESTSTTDTGDGGPATSARFNEPIGVAVNAAGDVFISERDEDPPSAQPHHPRIRRVDHATGIITLFAGGLAEGYNGEGHPALQSQLADPIGMRFDGAGNLYFGELGNNRIRKIAASGDHVITTVAGNGAFPEPNDPTKVPFNAEGAPATQASLVRPVRLALVPKGCGAPGAPACQVYFGDSGHHCVRMIDTSGNLHTVVNAPTTPNVTPIAGDSGDGGPGALALLMTPAAVLGPNDQIIVIDDAGNRVRRYDPASMIIYAFAGTGEGGFGGDGGPAARALLNRPAGLAVDGNGNVFVSEHDNHRIRRIANDANRTIGTYAGNGSRPDGGDGDGGPAPAASFDQPTGVAFTPLGDLLVSDAATEKVRRIDHTSTIITTFAGTGTAGSGGDGGQATSAQLNTPLRTAVTAAGDVFIADFNNNRIRHVDPSGRISTFASGTLNNPAGLAFGSDGLLYVSDFGNERIVAIDSGGTIHTVAGTGVASGSIDGEGGNPSDDRGDGGPAGAATFSDPTGVSFDVDGSLLVTDQGNNVIRRIALDGSGSISQASIVTTIAGNGQGTYGGDGGGSTAASLSRPTEAIALTDGRILIADRGNQRVRLLTPVASLCDVSCDDGDPCTVDSCDPATGCHHAASQDSDGDGVCDAVDDCPTVPDPNQDKPCPGGGGGGGSGDACAAGKAACIPGAGPQATDCLVETVVTGAQGTPVVRCTDGDPTCDSDPAPGHCGFTVSMCFNNADPRLACTANGVARVAIRATMKPRAAARGLVSSAIGAVTHVAGGSPRGAKIVFPQPLTTANLCTQAMTAEVSVRGRPGHARPGKGVLVITAKAAGHGRDVDQIRLVCVP